MTDNEPDQSGKININIDHSGDGRVKTGDIIAGDKITAENATINKVGRDQHNYHGLTVAQVEALFHNLQEENQPKTWNGQNPYLGLNAFQLGDAKFFFGRETLVDELLEQVKTSNFITITGPSGSGKSSVARAGLLYALKSGRIERSEHWVLATMQPAGNPMEQLARAFGRATQSTMAADTLRQDPRSFPDQVDMHLTDDQNQRLVLLVDQFEELFTQTKDIDERVAFINLLTTAIEMVDSRIKIILALRSDFISQAIIYSELRRLMNEQTQFVGGMSTNDLAKAIIKPALVVGASIEPSLVSQVIEDMKGEPGTLPLLSFALRDLFERKNAKRGDKVILTLSDYLDAGGLEHALEQHADKIFATFSEEQQLLAKNIFSKLIEVGQGQVDTRRTAALSELIPAGKTQDATLNVVEALAQQNARLLITNGGKEDIEANQTTVTIAHERLIDAWPWLRQLVNENRELITLQNQISDDAQIWLDTKDESYLYRGGRLSHIKDQWKNIIPLLNNNSYNFVQAGIQQQKNELQQLRQRAEDAEIVSGQLRNRRNLSLFAAGVAIILAIIAFAFSRTATQNAEQASMAQATSDSNAELAKANESLAATSEAKAIQNLEEAVNQADIATENLTVALSRQLASYADIEFAKDNPDLSLLLAIEAGYKSDTLEAYSAIQNVLTNPGQPLLILQHRRPVRHATWNNSESQILTSSWDHTSRIWNGKSGKELLRLQHNGAVNRSAWNKDETLILTSSDDNTARIWDVSNGTELLRLQHDHAVNNAIWSHDNSLILTRSRDYTARVWDASEGTELLRLDHEDEVDEAIWNNNESQILTRVDRTVYVWDANKGTELFRLDHEGHIYSAVWNNMESFILAYGQDNTARVWDAKDGTELLRLQHEDVVNDAVWNKDESLILTGSQDKTVRIWDVRTGEEITRIPHNEGVSNVAWNHDESMILSSGYDGTIRIWDASTGDEQTILDLGDNIGQFALNQNESKLLVARHFDGIVDVWDLNGEELWSQLHHDHTIWHSTWNKDGSRILTAGDDNTVRVWDITRGAGLAEFGYAGSIYNMLWSEDNSKILVGGTGKTAHVLDVASRSELMTFPHALAVGHTIWNKDESKVLTFITSTHDEEHTVYIWDTANGQKITSLSHHDTIRQAVWNSDESRILTSSWDYQARIWDAESGEILVRLQHQGGVNHALWNSDETRLLTSSWDSTARIWDARNGAELMRLQHDGTVRRAFWSQDESRILTFSDDHTARIWDAATGQELIQLRHNNAVKSAEWNADESQILTHSSIERVVRVWDAQSGDELFSLRHDTDKSIDGALWNNDESKILTYDSGDNMVYVWSALNGKEVFRLQHEHGVNHAIWNNDGSRILTSSSDNMTRIWDAKTGEELIRLQHYSPAVESMWNEDETQVLARTAGTISVFIVDIHLLTKFACLQAPRNFTRTEWQKFMGNELYRATCPNLPIEAASASSSQQQQHFATYSRKIYHLPL